MNDHEYFLHYIKAFDVIFPFYGEDIAYIKDANFKYQAVTNKTISMLGCDTIKDVLDKTIDDIIKNCNLNNLDISQIITKQDLQIQKDKKPRIYLQVIQLNGENKIWIQRKNPIINPATNNFIGIRGQISKLVWTHAIKILLRMHNSTGLLINHKNKTNCKPHLLQDYPLNNKQHMILFLCINNYSYSEISVLLDEFGYSIKPVRVNDYLEQLKLIFHVHSKKELAEKAIGLGFHTFLPDGLFNKLSSLEITEEDVATISNHI